MTIAPFPPPARSRELDMPPGRWHGRLWVSDGPLTDPGYFRTCVADFERTMLWPVLIPHDLRFAANGEDWIDDRGRLAPADGRIGAADPELVLSRWWDPSCCDRRDCLRPFGATFPGLAKRTARGVDPIAEAGNTGSVLAARGHYRLGLVETERPADIPALLGWTGMIKSTDDVAALSAVMRTWEDRFGATLIVLGFDALELSVAAPPKNQSRALAVAAEHRAFSLRSFTGQHSNLREFAAALVHNRHWRFSWD
ncbi:DUF4253 domain-containing protein [Amycolatopsis sp. CA-230715]|uniref:DUF4253 domain-containing protein n=1 Tax=Amycolatopsis sp. CA-230715 TaxID=2745196 RepID=UPI001C01C096|nr:DUF4253 domain-containing protein [Amycolatopsis sp. CA-230715]QWF81630.1 hypothetical protein HUW46_05063 [Amycolatopsis sp. CA-230715]